MVDARIEANRSGVMTVQVYGHEYTAADVIMLHADVEVIHNGYDEKDGARYACYKPGKVSWRITRTTAQAREETLFVSLDKPAREDTGDGVVFTWGAT